MKIIKRIELSNGMNLSVVRVNRVIIFNSRFVTGLEINGKLYFSKEKKYRRSLKDCMLDVLDQLSLYNQGIDLKKIYTELYLFQKSIDFSKIKRELKTIFQNWLAKDSLLKKT